MAYEKQNFLDGQIVTADHLNHIEDGIIDLLMVYPVGSIYISVNSTSPAVLFGGTWEILNDVFLLAAGSYANAGTFGGEAEHTLTVDEMPPHSHDVRTLAPWGNEMTLSAWSTYTTSGTITDAGADGKTDKFWDYTLTHSKGNGVSHNNMPPYLAVYMWKRVA